MDCCLSFVQMYFFDPSLLPSAGFIVGIFSIGCIISSLPPISAHCINVWGRKNSIIIGSGTFLAGSALQVLASSILMILCGRFIAGLSIGLLSAVVSLYQSELAPPALRGCLTSVYQLMITAGILLAAVIDHFLVHLDGGWRWAIAIQMGPAVVLLLCMPLMPKSPRWLVQQDRIDEAFVALKMVRDEVDAEMELAEIIASHRKEEVPWCTTVGTSLLHSIPKLTCSISIKHICCRFCTHFLLLALKRSPPYSLHSNEVVVWPDARAFGPP